MSKADEKKRFEALFAQARQYPDFWEEDAITEFAEEVCFAIEDAGISETEFERRLGMSHDDVVKLLSGEADITLRTMVRFAFATGLLLRVSLEPWPSRKEELSDGSEGQVRYLTEKQLAARLNLTQRILQKWRLEGAGPPYHKFGKAVRYALADVEAYERGRRANV